MLREKLMLALLSAGVVVLSNVEGHELRFESCANDGWSCANNTNGNLDLTFSCPRDFQRIHPSLYWEFNGLPTLTQSVTIKDCEATLSVGISTKHVAIKKYPHLCSFVVRDIAELIIKETTFSMAEMLSGSSTIKFENILKVDHFTKNTIGGSILDENSLKSFTFEMRNIHINNIQERGVWWSEGEIPFKMIWDNVTASLVEGDAIHIADTKKNPKTQIIIKNCKFGKLKRHSFNIHSTDFEFIDNTVDSIEKSAFRITSNQTHFLNNDISRINNHAFLFVNIGSNERNFKFESNTIHEAGKLSMNFGAPSFNELTGKISFHGNKFDCNNSGWLQKHDNEKVENEDSIEDEVHNKIYLKKIEKLILDDKENVCIGLPCLISVSKFKDLYKKDRSTKDYCI